MKEFLLLRYRQLAAMADGVARRLSSTTLQRIYFVVLSLPLLAVAIFTIVYFAFFAYGLWHGHAIPSAELYFTFPSIGRLLAGKGHISNACMAWALTGFCLSQITRKGAPQAVPLESLLRRPMRILALPICVSIVLALQGAAVFFFDIIPTRDSVCGIIPFVDGNAHYAGAIDYYVTGFMSDWVLRRPLSALLNAAFLGVCGGDLLLTVVLRCFVASVAIWLLAGSVARHYGVWSGIAVVGMALFFVTAYLSNISSEVLGFIWGCVAVALWLEAIHCQSLPLELAALGITGVALLTRMGPMFLLPMFALYTVWKWKTHPPDGMVHSLPRLCIAVGLVVVLLTLANAGASCLGKGHSRTGSNFSNVLVGLSLGDDWRIATIKYGPQMSAMGLKNEDARSNFMYRKAIANIWERPTIFLNRLWQGEKEFWKGLPRFLSLFLPFLLFVCVSLALRWWKGAFIERGFWLAYWLGVSLSIPFFFFDSSRRVNIVAYPFMAVFIALAFVRPQKSSIVNVTHSSLHAKNIMAYAMLLFLLMLMTAVFPRVFAMRAAKAAAVYADSPHGKEEQLMLGDGNAPGMLVVDDATPCTPGPVWQIHRNTFKPIFEKHAQGCFFLPETPFAFMSAPRTGRIVVAPPDLLLKKSVMLWKIVSTPFPNVKYFYIVNSAKPIEIVSDKLSSIP